MKTTMATTFNDSSFSNSKRHFQWRGKTEQEEDEEKESLPPLNSSVSSPPCEGEEEEKKEKEGKKKQAAAVAILRLRSVLAALGKARRHVTSSSGMGSRVTGTLFGYRQGHVHFAFQEDPKAGPALLIELATPTSGLVREMASGLIRIALECDKKEEKKGVKLLEEPLWRTYCNGKKCGFAMRRECGPAELKVLKAVEPISMGAGVLPGNGAGSEGELMYMRAKFERVVGSRDSEAFYMMNPEPGSGGPELSIYLLRV